MLKKIAVYTKNNGKIHTVLAIDGSESSDGISYSEDELKKLKAQYESMPNNIVLINEESLLAERGNPANCVVLPEIPTAEKQTVESLLVERGHRYGDYMTNAVLSQKLKSVMRESENWDKLPMDMKESFEMIAVKIARALNGDYTYPDNMSDLAGFATLVADRLKKAEQLKGE